MLVRATNLLGLVMAVSGCGVGQPATELEADLAAVLAEAPFAVFVPGADYELTAVQHAGLDGPRAAVDLRFRDAHGRDVHVFQTNAEPGEMGPSDPLALPGGDAIEILGRRWIEVRIPGAGSDLFQLATRIDGVTITVDAADRLVAAQAAAELAEAAGPD
jgi:hypothetical protein